MAVDLSFISYLTPLIAFLLIFLVCSLAFLKFKILGDNKFMAVVVSLLIAALFVSFSGVQEYVALITPWFAVFLIALFFLLMLIGLSGKVSDGFQKGLGTTIVIAFIVMLVISAIVVFSHDLLPWVPGSIESTGNPVYDWASEPPVFGAIILVVLAGLVSWVLIKKTK